MREARFLFRGFGKWKWLPVAGIAITPLWLWLQIHIAQEIYPNVPLYTYVGNALPVFAGVWPALSLKDAVSSQGGELFFHWRNRALWWIGRTTILIAVFALPAYVVSYALMAPYGPVGIGLTVRFFLFSWMYGWLGFCAMWISKEITWALFACLLFLMVHGYGRMLQHLFWNPYRESVLEKFESVSVHQASASLLWSVACLFYFAWALRTGRFGK